MIVIDPGHSYGLKRLDEPRDVHTLIQFVKRKGTKYPGNESAYPGTTVQEVLRACIDRLQYLNKQDYSRWTSDCIGQLRTALNLLEIRAAERHGAAQPQWNPQPELEPVEANGHWAFKEKK